MKISIGSLFIFGGCMKRPKRPRLKIKWRASLDHTFICEGYMSELFLSSTQQSVLAIRPSDVKGNPAGVDGIPGWSLSNEDVVRLVVAEDGMSAALIALGVGSTQVSVSVDARFGPEEVFLTGSLDVTVTPAEAVAVGIVAGAPTEQPVSV